MNYKEKEIARLEGMKDGLIKKLVDECEEINEQIIALRNGTPRKKDSQIYYERGYKQGRADKYQEITSEYMLMTEELLKHNINDAIDDFAYGLCCYACFTNAQKDAIRKFAEQLKGSESNDKAY